MCRLSDLTQDQINNLVNTMPDSDFFDFIGEESYIGVRPTGSWGTWEGGNNPIIVTYTEMMQLLGNTMQFTKSDLKTGMFVKYRNGDMRLVLGDIVTGDYWSHLSRFDTHLNHKDYKERDIMSVYTANEEAGLKAYFDGKLLKLIWERTEQSPAQKEMEELRSQISKLQEQAKVLQSKL